MANASSKRKKILLFLFILLNILTVTITALAEFTGGKPNRISISGLKLHRLALAVALFAIALAAEVGKYALMIRVTTKKSRPLLAYQVAVLGRYYDNVTPLGAGGQPFQIHFLHKQGVPVGPATSLPIAGFLMNQGAFTLLVLVGFALNAWMDFVTSPVLIVSATVGILFYVSVPLALLLFTFLPKAAKKLLVFFVRFGHKLRLVKDMEAAEEKVLHSLEDYRKSLVAMSKTKALMLLVFLLSLLYQICICAIPYFVLTAFGTGAGFIEIFFMFVYTHAAVTFVPTPGNAGAAEGTFYALFKTLDSGYVFWAMIFWRFLTYYMFILLGAGLLVFQYIQNKRGKKKGSSE